MLIGISGYAQSGKDTICELLQHHGIIKHRYAFADPLKACCNALFGWGERQAFGDLKEIEIRVKCEDLDYDAFCLECTKYGLDKFGLTSDEIYDKLFEALDVEPEAYSIYTSPREVYQLFGTEVGRQCLHTDIWVMIAPSEDVAIPDIRFPNEAEWLQSMDGAILRVVKDDCKPIRAHESESHIESMYYDYLIDNNGSLYELETQIMQCFAIPMGALRKFESTVNLQYTEADTFKVRVETLRSHVGIATSCGNWDYAPYLHGMANGLILALAVMEDNPQVDYKEAPDEFLCDRQPGLDSHKHQPWIVDSEGNYRHVHIEGDTLYVDGVLIGEVS